jgi:hypothetical protein
MAATARIKRILRLPSNQRDIFFRLLIQDVYLDLRNHGRFTSPNLVKANTLKASPDDLYLPAIRPHPYDSFEEQNQPSLQTPKELRIQRLSESARQ